jgi:hypothetical protein
MKSALRLLLLILFGVEFASAQVDLRLIQNDRFPFQLNGVSYEASSFPQDLLSGYVKDTSKYSVRASQGTFRRRAAPSSEVPGEFSIVVAQEKRSRRYSSTMSFIMSDGSEYILSGSSNSPLGINSVLKAPPRPGFSCSQDLPGLKGLRIQDKFAKDFLGIAVLGDEPIKLLAAYTKGVVDSHDGDEGVVLTKINQVLIKLNATLLTSGLSTKVQLACDPHPLSQTGYEHAGASIQALEDGDGVWDDLHTLRKSCKADLVHVFYGTKNFNSASGHALIPPFDSVASARWGFGASYLPWAYSAENTSQFTHEIGHNLGPGHANNSDEDTNKKLGLYPDSKGYRFVGVDGVLYRTIMAYPPGKIYFGFSNPMLNHMGTLTGVSGKFDNARVVSVMSPIVKEYSQHLSKPDVGSTFTTYLERFAGDPATHVRVAYSPTSNEGLSGQFVKLWRTGFSEDAPHQKNITPLTSEVMDIPFLGIGGTFHISLYPSRYIFSSSFSIPSLKFASIKITANDNNIGSGKVTASDKLTIQGNWLSVYYYNSLFGDLYLDQKVHPDENGNFIFSTAKKGSYWVEFPEEGGTIIKSNTINN